MLSHTEYVHKVELDHLVNECKQSQTWHGNQVQPKVKVDSIRVGKRDLWSACQRGPRRRIYLPDAASAQQQSGCQLSPISPPILTIDEHE